LRFEASYRLYGNDIDETTNPLEAGLGWTVKLSKEEFIGRDALCRIKEEGPKRKFVGIELESKRIARHGCAIVAGGRAVGTVTSGAYAPYLQKSLAMGYIPSDLAKDGLELELKGTRVPASFVKIPFLSGRERQKTVGGAT
jgi:aminomethyltransferase